ncbi:DUF6600 domain-containing protein [candidate division CSSED10-310 bacterium]|uniref:DUF6600 domain-containing protein n=1 Tax=candidate division CSSED10-310 bacterium TaxID=2855610 RepID=A0ABV6Z278_UNCC1
MKFFANKTLLLMGFCFLFWSSTLWGYETNVGRVSHLDGKVFFQSGRSLDWVEAYMNSPVQEGDRIWTDIGTYCDIQLNGNVHIRFDSDTKLDVIRLAQDGTVVKLWLGNIYIRIVNNVERDQPIKVESPDCQLNFLTPGLYRVDVTEENMTFIRIYDGVAEAGLRADSLTLKEAESIRLSNGERISPIMKFTTSELDQLGQYNADRDERLLNPASSQYVDRSVSVGLGDLDYYGVWVYDNTYGYSWRPRVHIGWVPYRFGQWVYICPWGWTWISWEPWGWLPFHYGCWYYSHYHGWMWKPDRYYSPAWVSWTAHGNTIGWVPIHPEDMHGYHWQAHGQKHWHANITDPRNASLHIGIKASTHINIDAFQKGTVIKTEKDIIKVNRGDIGTWEPQVLQKIKPVPQSFSSIPSKLLREKSRVKTWSRERTDIYRRPPVERSSPDSGKRPSTPGTSLDQRRVERKQSSLDSPVRINRGVPDKPSSNTKDQTIDQSQNTSKPPYIIRNVPQQPKSEKRITPSYRRPYDKQPPVKASPQKSSPASKSYAPSSSGSNTRTPSKSYSSPSSSPKPSSSSKSSSSKSTHKSSSSSKSKSKSPESSTKKIKR